MISYNWNLPALNQPGSGPSAGGKYKLAEIPRRQAGSRLVELVNPPRQLRRTGCRVGVRVLADVEGP